MSTYNVDRCPNAKRDIFPNSRRPRRFSPSPLFAICVLVTCVSLSIFAQATEPASIEKWYRNNRITERYAEIRDALSAIFDSALLENLPTDALMQILREGAAKRVAPELLLNAVDEEYRRLRFAGSILIDSGNRADDPDEGSSARTAILLKRMSVLLRTGFEESALRRIVSNVGDGAKLDAILEALSDIALSTSVESDTLLQVGEALLSSRIDPPGYTSISAIYVKGRLQGLSVNEITHIIVQVLESGGSIIQIDNELSRRRRER